MKKQRIIQFRVEPRLGECIDLHAKELQLTVSEFVRSTMRNAINTNMAKPRHEFIEEKKQNAG